MAGELWLDEDEAAAWSGLQMMQMRLNARLARDLAQHSELGYQDYVVLVALTATEEGHARLFELAHWLGWEKSRLSHHVNRMVDRRLVVKRTCPSDRRGAVIEVTERGRRELAQAAPSHVAAVRRLFVDNLDKGQLATLARVCAVVLAAVEAEEAEECSQAAAAEPLGCPLEAAAQIGSSAAPGQFLAAGDR